MSPPLDAHDQEGQPLESGQQTSEEVVHLCGADNRPSMLPVGCRAQRGSARDALPGVRLCSEAAEHASQCADAAENCWMLRGSRQHAARNGSLPIVSDVV